jgi:hypothetical protein
MARVRFLQGAYLFSLDKVMNYNDELEINDEKIINTLAEKGIVDVLIEEKKEATKKSSSKRTAKKAEE